MKIIRHTKIVCTIGPASGSPALIRALIRSGMNIARLNLSHGSLADHAGYVQIIREASQAVGTQAGILLDLPGPKYRTGKLKNGQALLKKGAELLLTTKVVEGNAGLVPVNFPSLTRDIKAGDTVLLNDGILRLRVKEVGSNEIRCQVTVGGILTDGRGLVVPGMKVSGPFLNDAMRQFLRFAVEQQPDYLALSFVTGARDILDVKDALAKSHSFIPVISKIERAASVKNFNSILEVSDGIMVARGDLGLELPIEKLPLIQKEIISKCNRKGKPVITATEMLESMVRSIRPTRAETTDVSNAIFDGTDATMLSAETAVGKYPVESIRMMARIARESEKKLNYELILLERGKGLEHRADEVISYDACYSAHSLRAAAIVAFTQSGSTAGRLSRCRPRVPILALSPNRSVIGKLLLFWGVIPYHMVKTPSMEELFTVAVKLSKQLGLAEAGDLIIIAGGIPLGQEGATNLLKVQNVD